jgi:hypothetical protein
MIKAYSGDILWLTQPKQKKTVLEYYMPPRPTRFTNLPPELIRRIMEPANAYAIARAQAASRTVRSALRNRLAGPATPMPGAENIRVSEPDASHVQILAHRIALLHAWTVRAIGHYNRTAPHPPSIRARYQIIADYWTETAGELRGMGRLVFTNRNGDTTTSLQRVSGTWEEDDDPPHIRVEISARSGAHDAELNYDIYFDDDRAFLNDVWFTKVGLCSITNRGDDENIDVMNVTRVWRNLDLNLWSTMPQGIGGVRQVLRHVHLLKRALLVAFRQPVRMTFYPDGLPRPFGRLFKMMGLLGN